METGESKGAKIFVIVLRFFFYFNPNVWHMGNSRKYELKIFIIGLRIIV